MTPVALHTTLTLANRLLGLAPGPIAVGRLADRIGLAGALQLLPISCVAAAVAFALGSRTYTKNLANLRSGT